MEPLTGKLGNFNDVLVMGKGMIVEIPTGKVTVGFCSILKKSSGTFSGKAGNRRVGVGGPGCQDQNFAGGMETRCTEIMSEFTSS